jgi:hypothetical protein
VERAYIGGLRGKTRNNSPGPSPKRCAGSALGQSDMLRQPTRNVCAPRKRCAAIFSGAGPEQTTPRHGVVPGVLHGKTPRRGQAHPEGGATAQGIGGAGPPQVAIGHGTKCRDGTPAKPGFRRSRKCAQMNFWESVLFPVVIDADFILIANMFERW